MEILQISLAVMSAVVLLLGVLVVFLQRIFIRSLEDRYREIKNNLKNDTGWLKKDIDTTAERVTIIQSLPIIEMALQEKTLKELNEKKNKIEKEIERLTK